MKLTKDTLRQLVLEELEAADKKAAEHAELHLKSDDTGASTLKTRGKKTDWKTNKSPYDKSALVSGEMGVSYDSKKGEKSYSRTHIRTPEAEKALQNEPWEVYETDPSGKTYHGYQEPETTMHRTAESLNKSQLKQMIEEEFEHATAQHQEHGEGVMAKRQLLQIGEYSKMLMEMLEDNDELPSWVQAKLTKAADYMDTVYHYMNGEKVLGEGEQRLDEE